MYSNYYLCHIVFFNNFPVIYNFIYKFLFDIKDSLEKTKSIPLNFANERARLQNEAQLALAQAKEMARMQMKIEKRNQMKSPISEIVRNSFDKVSVYFENCVIRHNIFYLFL